MRETMHNAAGRRRFLADVSTASLAAGAAMAVPQSRLCAGDTMLAPAVIDTHTHFYDPSRPGGVPWPGRDDALLYRPVLPAEWQRLVEPLGVTGTVVVEASPLVDDNRWLLDLADRHALERSPGMLGIVGVVGSLPLGEPACVGWIERLAKHPLFRGIRVNGDKLRAGLDDRAYSADIGRLAEHGLSIDINGGRLLAAAAAAAAAFPRLRIVVDHMGNTPMSEKGPLPEWRQAIERAAGHENVFLKVSALAESAAPATGARRAPVEPAFYEPWLDAVWEAFGERRLMYGSNWPVCEKAATYADVLGIVKPYVARKGGDAERWFYAEASRTAYRWVAPTA